MQETRLQIDFRSFAAGMSGSGKLAYVSPEILVQQVELEGAIAASATSSTTPTVTDPTTVGEQAGGDISF